MPIDTAYMTTSPNAYWRLNGNGTDSAGSHLMTPAGDFAWVTGPEIDTQALKIGGGGTALSAALGLSGTTDFTIASYVSVGPTNIGAGVQWLMNIGVVGAAGAGSWGPGLGASVSSGIPSLFGAWFSASQSISTNAFAQPLYFWKHVAMTYIAATKVVTVWINGASQQSASTGQGSNPIRTTDGLSIQFPTPIIVSHVAAWQRALTSTELANIGGFSSQWPYTLPINQQVTVDPTVTVDLTPVLTQTTQILDNQTTTMPKVDYVVDTTNTIHGQTTTIETDTHNMVNSLFPQLADFLNTIEDGITAAVTTGAGLVSRTIGQMLSGREGDTLTEFDFGTTCDTTPATYELGGGLFFQAQFIVTAMPDWYVITGPGDTYITQSLGTIEFHRGGVLERRIGLHTTTLMVAPLPGIADVPLIGEFSVTPGDYQIVVYPAPGVCINTKAYHLP